MKDTLIFVTLLKISYKTEKWPMIVSRTQTQDPMLIIYSKTLIITIFLFRAKNTQHTNICIIQKQLHKLKSNDTRREKQPTIDIFKMSEAFNQIGHNYTILWIISRITWHNVIIFTTATKIFLKKLYWIIQFSEILSKWGISERLHFFSDKVEMHLRKQ